MNNLQPSVGKYRWTICSLLFFATTINYLDRQVLSLLKPTLEEEFGWTNTQYANIAAAFQFTYAISLLFAGRLVDKLGTKKGYVLSIILWSLGAMIHAFSVPIGEGLLQVLGWTGMVLMPASVLGFMFSRAFLAVGEAGNFPAAIKATAEYFPKKERSFATGIFNSGANIGAVLAPLTVPWIVSQWGWGMTFIIIGSIGFVWLAFWLVLYEKPEDQKRLSAAERAYINQDVENTPEDTNAPAVHFTWSHLLKFRQTWSFVVGKFLTDGSGGSFCFGCQAT